MQQDYPDDYVLATGKTYTVRSFVERCFNKIGKSIVWDGTYTDEIGKDSVTGKTLLKLTRNISDHVRWTYYWDTQRRQSKNLDGFTDII